MSTTKQKKKDIYCPINIDAELAAAIDAYAAKYGFDKRSQAIRRLVVLGLEADRAK